GWFPLLFSHEVRPGGVMQVDALGRRFAVFRGKSGKVGVLDAFCPHGGASLCGPTAQVVGENIQCPFHLMEFDTHGRVVKVPWLDAGLPAANDALAWHCGEWHGYICVWFDAEKRPPAYALPAVSELKTMRYCGRWLVDRPIYMHLQEFTENTVDVQHFTPMHGSMALPWTNSDVPGINVAFASKVVLGRDKEALKYDADARPEYLYFINESSISFLGRGVPRTSATVVVKFVGPGGLVRFLFTLPNALFDRFQTHLPLNEYEGLAQRVGFSWHASRGVPAWLASYVVGEWVSNWWRDVWEDKVQRRLPPVLPGDGPISKGRSWFKQFYSESSPAMRNVSFDW
ncbi:Rieske [2Fe-2S] iron-sulfur domain-containing protein, partial [Pelagophyceae sp. CCMP2097]